MLLKYFVIANITQIYISGYDLLVFAELMKSSNKL